MYRNYILIILCIIFLLNSPASANLHKIAQGAPVFIGETGLDISSTLNGAHQIAWWAEGSNKTSPPDKVITLSGDNYHYNISPDIFSGHEGNWYTWDKKPSTVTFVVAEPQIDLKIWDLDHNMDVTGQTIPGSTKITYRIETNLYPALLSIYRPDVNPQDSFYSVMLMNPRGVGITNIYSGSAGNPATSVYVFESKPLVKTSPYDWKEGRFWNRSARSGDGTLFYPLGTYTFSASQNLNGIQASYRDSNGMDVIGRTTTGQKTITFVADTVAPTPSESPTITSTTLKSVQTSAMTTAPVSTAIPMKTTYQPLPEWIAMLGIGLAGLFFIKRLK